MLLLNVLRIIALLPEYKWNLGTCVVTTRYGILKNIEPKCPNSSVKCSDVLDYKSYKSFNISNTGLRGVADHVFDNFDHLSSLSLASNKLTTLPEFVFSKLTNLEYVNLADNKIRSFNNTFVGLKNLDFLNVSNNELKSLEKSYFFGIPEKTNINVKGNALHRISTLTFHEWHEDIVKNHTEVISLDTVIPLRAIPRKTDIEVCFKKQEFGEITVNRVNILETLQPSNGCQKSYISYGTLYLTGLNIRDFTDNWYRIDDTVLVRELDFSFTSIRRMTRTMLNSLPETVTIINFFGSNLGSIEEGFIENMNSLRTNLSVFWLRNNSLTSTGILANFPSSLTELDLAGNLITNITKDSFSNLKRLSKLNLCRNRLMTLRYENLQNLFFLEYLDLSNNHLSYIEPNAFLDLRSLRELNLNNNKLYSLFKGTFGGLNNIQFLSLKINNISSIEMDAFDMPTLKELNLNFNKLRELNGDSFKGLSSLKRLKLAKNCVEKINSDFWKHLDTVKFLDISRNWIKKLENGDLSGMSKRGEGFVLISGTPIETIQGGVFSSLSEN